jgi:hypothetical protein
MMTIPHDVTDLALAPVVLALDERLEDLGRLDLHGLGQRIALDTNGLDSTRDMREHGLILAVQRQIDLHGWKLTWEPRGFALTHGPHRVVLGASPAMHAYVGGPI